MGCSNCNCDSCLGAKWESENLLKAMDALTASFDRWLEKSKSEPVVENPEKKKLEYNRKMSEYLYRKRYNNDEETVQKKMVEYDERLAVRQLKKTFVKPDAFDARDVVLQIEQAPVDEAPRLTVTRVPKTKIVIPRKVYTNHGKILPKLTVQSEE